MGQLSNKLLLQVVVAAQPSEILLAVLYDIIVVLDGDPLSHANSVRRSTHGATKQILMQWPS